jgi:hypothetical protein
MMTRHFNPRPARATTLSLLILACACNDGPVSPRVVPEPDIGGLAAEFACVLDVDAGTTRCRAALPVAAGGGPQLDLLMNAPYVDLTYSGTTESRGNSANEDTTITYLTVKNNVAQPIGTTDGINAHPDGIRSAFTSGPAVASVNSGTSGGSAIRLDNPDGVATFSNPGGTSTYASKPYVQHPGMLVLGATSSAKAIRLIYSPNVSTISFNIVVSAPVQHEYGWIFLGSPTSLIHLLGETPTFMGTVYSAYGVPLWDGIAWSSSNPSVVAIQSSTGEATAVGQGTATITATSTVNAQRKGTVVVTVDVAPEVVSTTPVDAAGAVARTGNITVVFSEPVNVSSASFALECPTGSTQAFSVSGSGNSTITLDPDNDLPAAATCTVTAIANQISDTDANADPVVADYVFSFQVGDLVIDAAPAVDSTAPADGTFNASPGGAVVVHFSEPISVSAGSFTLECTSGPQSFIISGSGTSTVTLSPVSSLPTGDTCTVTVLAAGVSDVDTNDGPDQLAENHSFWFVVDGFGG